MGLPLRIRTKNLSHYELGVDLRRPNSEQMADTLVRRAVFLNDQERALIVEVYGRQRAVATVARVRGEDADGLRRRLRILVARMLNPAFGYVGLHRETWPIVWRAVGTACILEGVPLRDTAARLNVSYSTVRRIRAEILAASVKAPQLEAQVRFAGGVR